MQYQKTFLLVPTATLHNIYCGVVQLRFDYCSVLWGNCAMQDVI